MRRLLKNYGLSLTLAVLFLVSWGGQFAAQVSEAKHDAKTHNQQFEWGDFWPKFYQSTFENWQSEFLQLLTFVVLTSFLIHKGSHESKDSDDRLEAKVDKIHDQLNQLTSARQQRKR